MRINEIDEAMRICVKLKIKSADELNFFNNHELYRGDNLLERLQDYEKEYDNAEGKD